MQPTPKIEAVTPSGRSRLLVRFRTGEQRVYDCAPLFELRPFHLLATPAFFRTVRVDPGGHGVSWNDDIDLSEYELWTNGTPSLDCDEDAPLRDEGGTMNGLNSR